MLNISRPKQQVISPIFTGDHEADCLYLKNLLELAGLQQTDVARHIGVSQPFVSQFVLRRSNSARVLKFFEELDAEYGEKLRGYYHKVKENRA